MSFSFLTKRATESLMYALALLLSLVLLFMMAEPTVSRGASASTTDEFTIRQQITDEISFIVPASDVTMSGQIQGVTGGTANGATQFAIRSNSNSGYTVDIAFSNSPAMRGETTLSQSIRNYSSSTEPSFNFNSSTSAQFGYTVSASTTADLDQSFLDNGSTVCNTGSADTSGGASCWMAPSTSNFRIINRSTAATTSATSTISFRIIVPSNPVPGVEEDFYTATATLTATNQ